MFKKLIAKLKSQKQTSAKETTKQDSGNPDQNPEGAYNAKWRNTPLWIKGDEENGYWITLGKYKLTEAQPTIGDVEKLIKTRDINLLITMMNAIIYANEELEIINKTQKEALEKQASNGTKQMQEAEKNA